MKVTNVAVDGDWAIVEMKADGAQAKGGWLFDNEYCWICRFQKVHSNKPLA